MRVTLVISTFGAGGAERVMAAMANHWAEHGREVTLITLASAREDFYALNPRIKRIGLEAAGVSSNIAAAVWNNLQRLKRLRQEIRASRPDIVLSFIDKGNVLTLAATLALRIPVVVSERIDPQYHDIGSLWGWLRRVFYPQAAALVVQTDGLRDWAERIVKSHAVHVIPNPVKPMLNGDAHVSGFQGNGCRAVAMGRLVTQKGFDLLLRAFAQCAAKHAGWSLIIAGEGPERTHLETLASDLGIRDRVRLVGVVQEPFSVLRGADLFVMSSRYEGFPNALLEAMACGCAVISTDCSSGPRDIIRDGIDGVLVRPDDVDSLAAAMDRLMGDQVARRGLEKRATEVSERFSTEKVMKMWDNLFLSILSGPPMADSRVQQGEDRQIRKAL